MPEITGQIENFPLEVVGSDGMTVGYVWTVSKKKAPPRFKSTGEETSSG
jgi:hypothetical protein